MPDDDRILSAVFNLPPEDAIKFFEKKGYEITFDWHEMKREAHTRAFTVAGVTQIDVLVDIRKAIADAQETGKSLESFKKKLRPLLEKKGWWGKKTIERPDGSAKDVDLSAPWRLKTIFQTNIRTAAMAGQYKGMKDAADIMPYWRYVAVMDGRTRDEHRKLHGKVLRHDDPFWDTYYPPNGWGCRCTVTGMTPGQLKRKGLEVSNGEAMAGLIDHAVPDGWDYNPGKSAWLPDPKNYPAWAKEKVDAIIDQTKALNIRAAPPALGAIVDRAKEFDNQVSFVGKLDPSDRAKISQVLEQHERELAQLDHEVAIVVTKGGNVFRVDGTKDRVHPEALGSDLEDAYVTHGHPADETEGCFSNDDFTLFRDYGLMILRGVDYEFIYELSREHDVVDEYDGPALRNMSPADFWHNFLIRMAKEAGFGYRRKTR